MINLDAASRLGLQLSNISLSPGGTGLGGMLQHHHGQHQQQMRAGYFATMSPVSTAESGQGNEENVPPPGHGVVGSECVTGLVSGIAIGSGRGCDPAKMKSGQK
jgi:hypothetical protein